jgi:DUF4097 and DUF4098 domain-containing protein YvlB
MGRALAGIVAVALVAGVPADAGARQQGRDFRAERTDRQTRALPLGPNGSLELTTLSGDITVTAGSGRDVQLEIVRRSRGRTEQDAALGLQEVTAGIDQQAEHATVRANYPESRGRRPYRVDVSYTVTAPAGTRITANAVSGNIGITNIKGDVSAKTVSGNVEVHGASRVAQARSVSGDVILSDITSDSGISANSVSGTIRFDRVKSRRLEAELVSGDIHATDITCDSAQFKTLSGQVDFSGRLTSGGRYEFTSHSGDVHLTLASSGYELQATTFSGSVRPDASLSLQFMSTGRGSLRGRVGDGSAFVVVNTFSGNVVIGK